MNTIRQTHRFRTWLSGLADAKAKAAIVDRLERAGKGNFGDHAPVGASVFEMRVHSGPGYRLYYIRRGSRLYILLCGGTKRSQKADIKLAHQMASEL